MKKILFMLCTRNLSGAEKMTILLANQLAVNNKVYYCSPSGSIEEYIKDMNVEFVKLDCLSICSIRNVVKKIKPDILHTVDYKMSFLCALANLKFIAHLHNNAPWLNRIGIKSLLFLYTGLKANKIITVSNSIMQEFVFSKYIEKKNIVLNNSVDLNEIVKKSLEFNVDKNYDLGFIGRMAEEKGGLEFVEIVNILKEKIPALRAVMIGGDGNVIKKVQKKIYNNKLENILDLVGFQKNPFPYLKQCKIVIMPSKWEGFGLTAVESMAIGKPVLGTPVGGLKEIITENCGKICKDIDEFVNQSYFLLINKNEYESKSQYAQERAKKYSDIKIYVNKVEAIYAEIIERNVL